MPGLLGEEREQHRVAGAQPESGRTGLMGSGGSELVGFKTPPPPTTHTTFRTWEERRNQQAQETEVEATEVGGNLKECGILEGSGRPEARAATLNAEGTVAVLLRSRSL